MARYVKLVTLSGGTGTGASNVYVAPTGNLVINSGIPSNSTTTGALIVDGGAGINGNLFIGANASISGNITTGNVSGSTLTGNVSSSGTSAFSTATFSTLANVTSTSTSTTTTNGALKVAGGVGIGGNINVGGAESKFSASTVSSDTASGALQVTGGVGVGGNLHVGGNVVAGGNISTSTLKISSATISTTTTNANIVLDPNGTGVVDVSTSRIVNLSEPTIGTDAATKDYVDTTVSTVVSSPNKISETDSKVEVIDPTVGSPGNVVVTVDNAVRQYITSAEIRINPVLNVQNLSMSGSSITATSSDTSIQLIPSGTGTVIANTTTAFKVPVGTTAQRPASPTSGQTRFNTSTGFLEFFNGTDWINASSTALSVTSQSIDADGIANSFALTETTTTDGIIVSINGTVQEPITAYQVVGGNIVFTQTPANTDTISVRYIAAGYTLSELNLPVYTKSAVLALTSPNTGQVVYVTNGDSGNPCLAVYNGSVWKIVSFGATLT